MILKFNEYTINESKLFLSDNFIDILNSIKSPISKVILDSNEKNIDKLNVNYVDMDKDKNDEVSFTQDSRILRDLKAKDLYVKVAGGDWISAKHEGGKDFSDLFTEFGITDIYLNLRDHYLNFAATDTIFELLGSKVAKADGIEYCLCKDVSDDELYIISKDGVKRVDNIEDRAGFMEKYYKLYRNRMKIGRLVRSLLNDIGAKFSDKDIEEFVNEYKAKIDNINNIEQYFEIVNGEDIRYWYSVDNYYAQEGSLGGSCMRYDKCQEYLDIYVDNKTVDLLILKSPNDSEKIIGRALLWTLTDGSTFMDRVYVCKDFYSKIFKEYASKNNWLHKRSDNSQEDCDVVKPDGSMREGKLEVKVNGYEYEKYPYADTLKFYYIFDKTISNKADKKKDYIKIEDTEGGIDKDDFGCTICRGDSNRRCSTCAGDGNISTECEICGGSGKENVECDDCGGTGNNECDECSGSGNIECESCGGSGKDGDDECSDCNGSKLTTCPSCDGESQISCRGCDGDGEVEVDCSSCDDSSGYVDDKCEDCDGVGIYSGCDGKIHEVIDNF